MTMDDGLAGLTVVICTMNNFRLSNYLFISSPFEGVIV